MDPITLAVLSKALPYAPGLISGGVRAISSYGKLKELEKQPLPTFDTTQAQQNINMYQRRFNQGLSPEERGAMSQQFQSEQAGMFRQTSERAGGQISNFLGRVTAMDRVRNAMKTGSMMAQERRAAMSGLAGARQGLQSQLNAQTQMDMRRRMAEEQALGQGMQAGLTAAEKGLAYGLQQGLGAMTGGSSSSTPTYTTPSPTAFSSYRPFQGADPLTALYGVRAGNFVQPSGTYDPTGLEDLGMEAGRSMTTVPVPRYPENLAF
jgi:hypothetical protein